jgi:hypothetical protein
LGDLDDYEFQKDELRINFTEVEKFGEQCGRIYLKNMNEEIQQRSLTTSLEQEELGKLRICRLTAFLVNSNNFRFFGFIPLPNDLLSQR